MIFGLEPRGPLPENWTPLEAIAVVKCLAADGEIVLHLSSTPALPSWEAIGMLTVALDVRRDAQRQGFCPLDEDDEDDEGP